MQLEDDVIIYMGPQGYSKVPWQTPQTLVAYPLSPHLIPLLDEHEILEIAVPHQQRLELHRH